MSQLLTVYDNCLGHTQVNKTTVEAEAREAAQNGTTMNDACPYPFSSEAGVHFKAVYLLALPQDASQKHKRG